jgi:hypothetical protein
MAHAFIPRVNDNLECRSASIYKQTTRGAPCISSLPSLWLETICLQLLPAMITSMIWTQIPCLLVSPFLRQHCVSYPDKVGFTEMDYPSFTEEMPRHLERTNIVWGGLGHVGREVFGGKQSFFRASKG